MPAVLLILVRGAEANKAATDLSSARRVGVLRHLSMLDA
jgi:hypothetical protein